MIIQGLRIDFNICLALHFLTSEVVSIFIVKVFLMKYYSKITSISKKLNELTHHVESSFFWQYNC